MDNEKIRRHIYLDGKVQGVGFRHFVLTNAVRNSVTGWVKNLYDGRVEAVFEGEKSNVKKLLELAEKGPRWASVESTNIDKEEYRGEFKKFRVKY